MVGGSGRSPTGFWDSVPWDSSREKIDEDDEIRLVDMGMDQYL